MLRAMSSPDANPGQASPWARLLPDCALLHPGYIVASGMLSEVA